jgi:small multidrug resistance family-3 protein
MRRRYAISESSESADPLMISYSHPMDENGNLSVLPISDEQQLSPLATVTTRTLLENDDDGDDTMNENESFRWTTATIFQALIVFIAAGVAEIGGGYLVWKAIRGSDEELGTTKKRWLYAILGSFILVLYGFIPTLQPTDSFGRIYAVYGGFFIVLSFLAGWYLDNDRPDLGDIVGGSIALVGVFVVLFWPR